MSWTVFRKTETAGLIFICLAILNWSGNFVAARALADTADPATINMLRWMLATFIFLPFGFRAFWAERNTIVKHWKELSFIALTGVSLYDTIVFVAGQTAEALNMSLISTLSPLLTSLVAQFIFKEKFKPQMYMGIALSTFGVMILITDGNFHRLQSMQFAQGDLLILCTAMMMSAAYNTTVSRIAGKLSQIALIMATCLFGTAQLIPLYLFETGGQILLPELTFSLVGWLLYLAIFASLLCYLFWNAAVQILGAPKAMLFYYTMPPVSGIVAWLVINEPMNTIQILCGLIISAGILLALYRGSLRFPRIKIRHCKQVKEFTSRSTDSQSGRLNF